MKDLSISILCNYLPHHNWMAFASWYSIYKNLPDAKVKIFCDKSIMTIEQELFIWTSKVQVEFTHKKSITDLEIPCDTMAIRDWIGPEICDAKSNDISTFCTYRQSCGNFVMSEWINSSSPPFTNTEHFKKEEMTVNEFKILELWRKALSVYVAIW